MKITKNSIKLSLFFLSCFLIISCGSGLNFFDQPSYGPCGSNPGQYLDYDELGSGLTAADPYIICNAHQLEDLAYENSTASINAFIVLGKNIDYTADGYASSSKIGVFGMPFEGYFDGRGFTIYNLYQYNTSGTHMGLFGMTENANIRNIRFSSLYVGGSSYLGALVGEANDTLIENISVSSDSFIVGLDTSGGAANIGGVIGYAGGAGSIIQHISNHASINILGGGFASPAAIGGLLGMCASCALLNSEVTGDITAINTNNNLIYIGGALGLMYEEGSLFRVRVQIDSITLNNNDSSTGVHSNVAGLVGNVNTTGPFIEIRDFEININNITNVSIAGAKSRVAGVAAELYSSSGMNALELGRGYFMGNITSNSTHASDDVAGIVAQTFLSGYSVSVSNIFTNSNINYTDGYPDRIVKSDTGGSFNQVYYVNSTDCIDVMMNPCTYTNATGSETSTSAFFLSDHDVFDEHFDWNFTTQDWLFSATSVPVLLNVGY